MKRRLLAILLTLSMIASLLPTAFAASGDSGTDGEEKRELLYVSLGDSMTNGYGLDGYDGVSGIMNYGTNTYSNKFAAWLAGYEGEIKDDQIIFEGDDTIVEHRQLAMSGMDAETLLWMLELDHAGIVNDDQKAQDAEGNWYSTMELYEIAVNGWNGWVGFDGQVFDNVARKGIVWNEDHSDAVKIVNYDGTECYSVYVPYFPDFSTQYTKSSGITNVHKNASGQVVSNKTGSHGDLGASMWFDELGFTSGHYFRAYEDIFKDHNYRMADGVAKILSYYYDKNGQSVGSFTSDYMMGVDMNAVHTGVEDPEYPDKDKAHEDMGNDRWNWLRIAAEFYQDSIKEADVISMAQGNTNFGTLMFNEIKNVIKGGDCNFHTRIGMALTDDPDFTDLYKRSGLSNDMIATIEKLMDSEIDPLIDSLMGDMLGQLKGYQKAEIKLIIKYCALSYLLSYTRTVEYIAENNSDVTLIQVALMNAYASTDEDSENSVSMGSLIDMIYEPINVYLAALPTYLQANGKYENVTFLYADCGEVETLSEVFGNDFYKDASGNYVKYPGLTLDDERYANVDSENELATIRNRFRYWIAGSGSNVTPKNYYLSSHGDPSYGEVWKGLLKNFIDDNATDGDFFGAFDLMYVTDGDLIEFTNLTNESIENKLKSNDKKERDWVFSCLMYMAIEDAVIRSGKQSFDMEALGKFSGINAESFEIAMDSFYESAKIEDMSKAPANADLTELDNLIALFQKFSDAMVNDPTTSVIFCLANRMEIGTGIGGHTSEGGHQTMFESIRDCYANNYTSADATKEKLPDVLVSVLELMGYEDLANVLASMKGMEFETPDDLAIIIMMLKLSNNAALEGVDLDELEADIRDLQVQLQEDLTAEEQALALEAANMLLDLVQRLASPITYNEYEVTEDSFYVSLGDSNVNGYGLDGYVENDKHGVKQLIEGSAPVMLAKALYGDDWKDHFGQYAQGALRCEDMLYILGDDSIVLDDYYYDEIQPNLLNDTIEATREEYIEQLRKADLISVAIGGGNVTTFTGEQVDRILADPTGNTLVEMNWGKIGFDHAALDDLDKLLDEMVPLMDSMGLLDKYLPEGMESIANPAAFARTLAESLLYGYASYNYYYTKVLDRIRELAPDAQILILGMFNPVDDWTLEFEGEIIPIGGIINNVMESANLQNLAYALQNDNTTYVDLSANITFLDEEYADKEEGPTFQVYYESILKGDGKEVHASAKGHEYMFNQMYAALQADGAEATGEAAYDYLLENYEEIYNLAWRIAENQGYIELAGEYLTVVENAIAGLSVDGLTISDELKAEIEALKAEVLEDVDALKAIINSPEHAKAAANFWALMGELEEDLDSLIAIANQVNVDACKQLNTVYDAFMLAGSVIDEMIWNYIDDVVTNAKEEAEDFVNDVVDSIEVPNIDLSEIKAVITELETNAAEIRAQLDALQAYTGPETTKMVEELETVLAEVESYAARLNALVVAIEDLVNEIENEPELTLDKVQAIVAQAQAIAADAQALVAAHESVVEDLVEVYETVMPEIIAFVESIDEDAPAYVVINTTGVEVEALVAEVVAGYEATLTAMQQSAANVEVVVTEAVESVCVSVAVAVESITVATEVAADEIYTAIATAIETIEAAAIEFVQSTDAEIVAAGEKILALVEEFNASYVGIEDKYVEQIKAVYEMVEVMIDALENVETIEEAEAILADAELALEILIDVALNMHEMAKNDVFTILADAEDLAGDVVDVVVTAGENIADHAVSAYNKSVDAVCVAVDTTIAAVNTALAVYEETVTTAAGEIILVVTEAAEKIGAEVAYVANVTVGAAELIVAQAEGGVEAILTACGVAFYDATHGEFTSDCTSYYVSIGGDYAAELAEMLGLDAEQYVELAVAGLTTADLAAMLDETVLAGADLVTVNVADCDYTSFIEAQIAGRIAKLIKDCDDLMAVLESEGGKTYVVPVLAEYVDMTAEMVDIEWSVYLNAEQQELLDAVVEEIVATMVVNGLPESVTIDVGSYVEAIFAEQFGFSSEVEIDLVVPVAEIAGEMVEWVAYAYVTHMYNYIETLNLVHELTDAEVVVVGQVIPMEEMVIAYEGVEIPVSEYVNEMLETVKLGGLVYAMLTPNTTYVEVSEGACVAECIYNALNVTVNGHNYEAVVTDATCTEAGYTTYTCTICGDEYVVEGEEAHGHSYDEGVVTEPTYNDYGYTTYTCTVCGHEYVADYVAPLTPPATPVYPYIPASHCEYCGKNTCHSSEFTDLNVDSWYHEYTDYVLCTGLMNGMGNKTFGPSVTTTRAMIVTILYRVAGSPVVSGDMPFTDVEEGKWYSDAILWAYQNGIVEGYGNDVFGTHDIVTREQMDTIFYRNAKLNGMDVTKIADISGYADADKVSAWALDAVKWAVAVELMEGRSATELAPTSGTTRAETATLFYRWCEEIL